MLCPFICRPLITSLRSGPSSSATRKTAPRPSPDAEDAGCKLNGLWYAFGRSDGFALIQAPDQVTRSASIAIAISASRAFRRFETTVPLTEDELLEALKKAQDVAYVAPRAAVHA